MVNRSVCCFRAFACAAALLLMNGCGLLTSAPTSPREIRLASIDQQSISIYGSPRAVLDSLQGERPTVVLLWASWCHVCIEDFPKFDRLARALQMEGIAVRGIAQMDTPSQVRRALEGKTVSFPISVDTEGALAGTFGAHALPIIMLFDAHGSAVPLLDPQLQELLRPNGSNVGKDQLVDKIIGPRTWNERQIAQFLQFIRARFPSPSSKGVEQ